MLWSDFLRLLKTHLSFFILLYRSCKLEDCCYFLWLENSLDTVIELKLFFSLFFFSQRYFSNMKASAYVLKLRHAFSIMFAVLRHLPYLFFSLFPSPCHSLYNFTCLQTHYYSPKIDKKDNRGKEIKKEAFGAKDVIRMQRDFFFLLYFSFFFSFLQLMYRFFSIGLHLRLVRTWNFFFFIIGDEMTFPLGD